MAPDAELRKIQKEAGKFYSQNLEKTLLGLLVMTPEHMASIDPAIFFYEDTRTVFDTMKALYAETGDVNLAVLAERMLHRRQDGASYVSSLLDGAVKAGPGGITQVVDELQRLRSKRRIYVLSESIRKHLADDDIEKLPAVLEEIKAESGGPDKRHLTARDILDHLEQYYDRGGGVKLGIHALDSVTGGIAPGEVVYLEARAKVIKSIFMQNCLRHFVINNPRDGAILFSLEMPAAQLGERMLMIESGRGQAELASIDPVERDEVIRRHQNVFYITESSLSLHSIYQLIVRLKFKSDIKFVIIDFLSRIKTSMRDEYDALRTATKFIKDMAKELDIAILVLAQTGRSEGGGGFTPLRIESGRGSGTIEEDADFVLGAYRPELNPLLSAEDRARVDGLVILQVLGARRIASIPEIRLRFNKTNLRLEENAC